MTGDELLAKLNAMTPEQRSFDLSVQVDDEYYTLRDVAFSETYHEEASGILDDGSPILISEASQTMRDFYENGECPDCGKPIPWTAIDGSTCDNCHHIFYRDVEDS